MSEGAEMAGEQNTAEGEGIMFELEGVTWTSNLQPLMDCLIYCQDGILMTSQVQLAAASGWLKQMLLEVGNSEENRIKTIILPFIQSKQMKQVLYLISGGNVILNNCEIQELVEISLQLGCTADMIKEPKSNVPEQKTEDSESLQAEVKLLVHQLEADRSIDTILEQMQLMQAEKLQNMEKQLEFEKTVSNIDLQSRTIIQTTEYAKEEIDEYKDMLSEDDFIVSDTEFSDYEGSSGYRYGKRRKESFDLETFEEKLIELGESLALRGGAYVECGVCDKSVKVPQLSTAKARLNHFKKNHFNNCKHKRVKGSTDTTKEHADKNKSETDQDDLVQVYNKFVVLKTKEENDVVNNTGGRKRAEVPPIQTIRSFLEAVGNAMIVNGGSQIKCGLCNNKLKVNPDRPIMGNIRYFERTHLVRCPVKLSISGKPKELISESFLPGRSSNDRVLKTINMFDNVKASIVSKLISEIEGSPVKRRPGKAKQDKENEEDVETKVEEGEGEGGEDDGEGEIKIGGGGSQYHSKRKQCLVASRTCFKCKVVFESGNEIESHFETDHSTSESVFHCLACQDTFSTYEDLTSHLETDHNYKDSYSCNFCEKQGYSTQYKLNRHISEKHPNEETVYFCSMCTKGFSSFNALKAHQKTHLGSKPDMMLEPSQVKDAIIEAHTCRFCGDCIMHGKDLDSHIRVKHELDSGDIFFYKCNLCPAALTNKFKLFYYFDLHLREHGVFMDNICRICKDTSLNRAKFNDHFKTIHPHEQPYDCPWPGCNKMFKKKQLQNEHITSHRVKEGDITDDMVHTCNECGKVFYSKKKYETHMKHVHEGKGLNIPEWDKKSRRYQCGICTDSFSTKSLLQAHARKHDNNPSFMCDHCGKAFYRKDRLAVHTRAVHLNQKNYECDICLKRFMDNYKLKRHMKTHISGRAANTGIVVERSRSLMVLSEDNEEHMTTTLSTTDDGELTTALHHATVDESGQVVVQVPAHYEIGPNNTIIRKLDGDSVIHMVNNQTILQINTPVSGKGTSSHQDNLIKFETEEVVDESNPVDFTQAAEEQRFIYIQNYDEKTD